MPVEFIVHLTSETQTINGLTLSYFLPRSDDVVGGIPVLAEDLLQAEPGALGHLGEHVHGVREDREERADAVAALGVGELTPGSGT